MLGADVLGADVSGAEVSGAEVSGAEVLGADVLGADVLGADVLGADVSGAEVLGADVLGALPDAVAVGVPVAEPVGPAGLVPPGENVGGVVGGEALEQADTDTEASMAKAAPPRTALRMRRRPQK